VGKGQRLKGANGEREFFKMSNELLGLDVFFRHPNPWHGHGKRDNHDPNDKLPVSIEVKRHETLAMPAWIRQSIEQAAAHQTPIVAYRQNGKPWRVLAVMDSDEWQRYLHWKFGKELDNASTD
jgi:hypothetical protein